MTDARRPAPTRQYRASVTEQSSATSRANLEVAIESASGIAMGRDGLKHPIEVNREGELETEDVQLGDLLRELQQIRELMQVLVENFH